MAHKKRHIILLVLLLLLAGCQAEQQPEEKNWVSGPLDEGAAGSIVPFTIPVERAGDPIGVDFRGALANGAVRVQLTDARGEVVWQEEVSSPGAFVVNEVINAPEAGEYRLGLVWDGPVQMQYSLQYARGKIESPTISPLALLSGVGMIVVAAGYIAYVIARRLHGGYLGLGALAWVVAVVLKFAWAIPINKIVYNALYGSLPEMLAGPIFYLYVGALTGVFEVALVWLVLRYTRLGKADWKRVLAFGIGFGAVEALLLGLSSLGNVVAAMLVPDLFPPAALEEFAKLSNVLYVLAPILERFFTVLVHILSNALLFYAVAHHQPRWFWLAFVYKTLIDTVAAYAQVTGRTLGKIWAVEAVVAVWGVLGWWGTRLIARNYPVHEGGHLVSADVE